MKPNQIGMLAPGNMHLGEGIHAFSIPARITCGLGITDACLSACYALDFFFLMRGVKAKHRSNYERAQDLATFVHDLLIEIRYKRVKFLRIHVAGDFFSIEYARAWLTVAKRCKTTTFLFYTRAWRDPAMRDTLIEFASLANVRAFWSEDRDTGPCDFPVGRRAFLCVNLQDELIVPEGVLVFRHRTRPARKWVNGSWICAKEQGTANGLTCSTCQVCLKAGALPVAPEGRGRDGSASSPRGIAGSSA